MRNRFASNLVTSTALAMLIGSATAADPECSPFLTTPEFIDAVPSPKQVLGFSIGEREVTTDESNRYLAEVDASSARVVTGTAATSWQGQPLKYAIIGREGHVTEQGLADIRKAVQQLADPDTKASDAAQLAASTPAILWVSGNVHGNEKSGADAALRVVYELSARTDCVVNRILDNAVVVVLPIQNPDGREANTRRNFYGFDMNRDWFARTQPETDGKLELLRLYRPVLYIDAHEFGYSHYFFPPNADPIYHEVPDRPFDWINNIYGASISAEMDRQNISYFHGAPYDLYAVEYGDSVPTVGFHAAGMTFEKYTKASIDVRAYEHFVAMWTSLFSAASNKERILKEWHASYVDARDEGSAGTLEPNGIYYTGKKLFQSVPANLSIRHYFLLDEPDRAHELATLIRRLQRMDVKVYRLDKPLSVQDFRRYGEEPSLVTLPSGTYWVPMAQAQKHWIQAMLHENPYIPVTVSYDISAWSNPLLMNIAGGSSGGALTPSAKLVPPVAALAPPGPPPGAPRIGLFQIPGSFSGVTSAGSIRYLFKNVWGVPYTDVDAGQIQAGLSGIDVLLVPDGYASYGLQALGSKGQRALADWVAAGGRYVGYVGGAELAVKAGVSTAVLKPSSTTAPGTLIRVKFDEGSALAQGVGPAAWVMYDDNNVMTPGLGAAAATFPAAGAPYYHTSGLAIGVDELAGTAAVVDEAVGEGRTIVFSFDPNFRAWSDGTQKVLWNALFAPEPVTAAAAPATVRAAAVDRAGKAAASLPDIGKAIRIVVHSSDADTARALIQRYGAEFKESGKSDRTIFLIENRKGLSREEHPFIIDLTRELSNQITPISIRVP